ncbi:MAG: hypothetical protein LBM04_10405 [Opitutaceae bacterium]|jgi:hypothetical protein|nr:hypothetical protein [Opitutaceae bacterium]
MPISAIGPMSPLLSAVKQLGRRHSSTLGFFSDGAFEDHAGRGYLLVVFFHGGNAEEGRPGNANFGCYQTAVR